MIGSVLFGWIASWSVTDLTGGWLSAEIWTKCCRGFNNDSGGSEHCSCLGLAWLDFLRAPTGEQDCKGMRVDCLCLCGVLDRDYEWYSCLIRQVRSLTLVSVCVCVCVFSLPPSPLFQLGVREWWLMDRLAWAVVLFVFLLSAVQPVEMSKYTFDDLWPSWIVLGWPWAVDRTLKSSYKLTQHASTSSKQGNEWKEEERKWLYRSFARDTQSLRTISPNGLSARVFAVKFVWDSISISLFV